MAGFVGIRSGPPAATYGTAYADKYSTAPITHLAIDDDEEFIGLLRDLHREKAATKEDNILLSPSHFEPQAEGAETRRGLANITHVRGVWLDNDGGELTHKEFARLFPYLRIVVWNTFSSTPAKPRWRVFIPTNYAMSIEVHRCIMQQFERVLRNAGYRSDKEIEKLRGRTGKAWKRHGFDTSKFNAASLFYAPCQAAHPGASFFVDFNDAKRGPLDLYDWIENCIADLTPAPEPAPDPEPQAAVVATTASQPSHPISKGLLALRDRLVAEKQSTSAGQRALRIEKALADWRSVPRGQGHDGFYRLGAALQWADLDEDEIRSTLETEARSSRSPQERRSEIPGILRSLRKRGTMGR